MDVGRDFCPQNLGSCKAEEALNYLLITDSPNPLETSFSMKCIGTNSSVLQLHWRGLWPTVISVSSTIHCKAPRVVARALPVRSVARTASSSAVLLKSTERAAVNIEQPIRKKSRSSSEVTAAVHHSNRTNTAFGHHLAQPQSLRPIIFTSLFPTVL